MSRQDVTLKALVLLALLLTTLVGAQPLGKIGRDIEVRTLFPAGQVHNLSLIHI